jgi:UrcA family protein
MQVSTRLSIRSAALAVCTVAIATAAAAQSVRFAVGDLSTARSAQAFDQRLGAAARSFCNSRYAPQDLDGVAACRNAVRMEALEQLTPDQQHAYAQAHRPPSRWAAR